MNYSRRQLEAFGEPFGEGATRVKPGGRIYGTGGGGMAAAQRQQRLTNLTSLSGYALKLKALLAALHKSYLITQ